MTEPSELDLASLEPGAWVRSTDLVAQTLDRVRLERVSFVDCDLSELVTRGTTFFECSFRRCLLNASKHDGTAFVSCSFERVDFFGAELTDCKLTGSTFKWCELRSMKVVGGAWDFLTWPRHDIGSCTFERVRMIECDMTGVRGRGVSLIDCDLTGCELTDADLRESDLRGSLLYSVDPTATRLDGAQVTPDQALLLAANLGLSIVDDAP